MACVNSAANALSIVRTLSSIKLVATIRSVREAYREDMASHVLFWIRDLLESGGAVVRKAMTKVLLEERRPVRSLLNCGGNIEINLEEGNESIYDQVESSQSILIKRRLRLDYLLEFDVGLWKEVRDVLKEIYIASLIVDGDVAKRHYGKEQKKES